MKKTELVQALQAMSQCTPVETSRQLVAFAEFIERRSGVSVSAILKTLETGRKAHQVPRRSPAELRKALHALTQVVKAAGTMSAISEIDRLAALLPLDSDCSLVDLLNDLEALAEKPKAKRQSSSPKNANEPLVQKLVAELNLAKGDAGLFPHLMQTLKNANKVDTPTLQRVGEIFLQRQKLGKGRKPILDALLARHHDELRYAFQESSLERLRK